MKRLTIRQGTKTYHAGSREFILYGAGQGLMELIEKIDLRHIRFVIDKKAEYGDDCLVQIHNEQYRVFPPAYLKEENLKGCIVLITSKRYEEEIRKTIQKNLSDCQQITIVSPSDLFMEYDSLGDLFRYDPIFIRKAAAGGLTFYVDEILRKFEYIIDSIGIQDEAASFMPLNVGNEKLCCVFGKDKKYFFSIPYIRNISSITDTKALHSYYSIKIKRELFRIRKKFGIGVELNLYEDESGFLLQYYASDGVDIYSEDYLKSVVMLLKKLHSRKVQVPRKFDIIDDYLYYRKCFSIRFPESDKPLDAIDGKARSLISWGKEGVTPSSCICHGDAFFTNIVGYQGKLYLIDWDFLCESDPLYDIGRVVFSIYGLSNKMLEKYEKVLEWYGVNGEAALKRVVALVLLNSWRQLFFQADFQRWNIDRLLLEADFVIEMTDMDLLH